jgi:hypothetical protein
MSNLPPYALADLCLITPCLQPYGVGVPFQRKPSFPFEVNGRSRCSILLLHRHVTMYSPIQCLAGALLFLGIVVVALVVIGVRAL